MNGPQNVLEDASMPQKEEVGPCSRYIQLERGSADCLEVEHLRGLLNTMDMLSQQEVLSENSCGSESIIAAKVVLVVRKFRGKATGVDDIHSKMLKALGDMLNVSSMLHRRQEKYPDDWQTLVESPVFKQRAKRCLLTIEGSHLSAS